MSYTQKYKNIVFQTEAEYKKWLNTIDHYIVTLKDLGQDLQFMIVHFSGEIINCDFNDLIYIGKFVDVQKMEVNKPLQIYDQSINKFKTYCGLIVEKIEIRNKNKN